jgi:hypothetical protein
VKRSQGRPRAGYRAAKRVEFRGADLVLLKRRQHPPLRNGLAGEEPRAVGDPMHVETSFVRNLGDLIPCPNLGSGRLGKAASRTPSMHMGEKSDGAIVPMKRSNNGGQPPAEVVEGRVSTKGNSRQAAAVRTQSRIAASIGMADVRRTLRRHCRLPSDVRPEVGARCVSSARRDLCGGR